MIYEIWQINAASQSDWDCGEGRCVETFDDMEAAQKALKEYQAGRDPSWLVSRED
jgi:hypothetical protein